jgi:hypothetical protein
LWPFGIFCGHLEYFVVIWNILWPLGIFYGYLGFLVCCTRKNLATLIDEIATRSLDNFEPSASSWFLIKS